jgi:nucleosome binding factor SPN SPT16 subunit
MVFNLRLSMANFDNRPTRNCLLIADTILIKEASDTTPAIEIMTKTIPKAYADISYSIDENDDDLPEEEKSAAAPRKPRPDQIDTSSIIKPGVGVIQTSRLRSIKDVTSVDDEKRKENQINLQIQKQDELRQRIASGELNLGGKGGVKAKDLSQLQAYKSDKEFPREAKPGQLFVDKTKNAILVPFSDRSGSQQFVPFHILTIKNTSINTEN